jgi:hypothetical protein
MYESGIISELVEDRRGAKFASGAEKSGEATAVEARKRKTAPESFIFLKNIFFFFFQGKGNEKKSKRIC